MSYDAKRLEKRYKKKMSYLDRLCTIQIQGLWKKHDSLRGSKESREKTRLMGKIVGIEWVLDRLKELDHKEERELDKLDARRY